MNSIKKYVLIGMCAVMSTTPVFAATDTYLEEEAYEQLVSGTVYEDRGIVLENYPKLGYMVYRNWRGEEVVANYYSAEMTVEKQPYDEQEDKIGYIDELFPTFNFDSRDTTIGKITPGDNVYLRMDDAGYITYISAYNDYTVRYGKVHTWTLGADPLNTLVLEDVSGRLYTYKIPYTTSITKAQRPYSLGQLREGEWVRVLVNQKILGYGIVEEEVQEIVVDPDSRVISDITRGELVGVNAYSNTVTMKDTQSLFNNGWGPYESLANFRVDPRDVQAYFLGKPVSYDYMKSRLIYEGGYAYAAVERFMGKEEAVKFNFQSKKQVTLEPTTVTYASPGVVRLLTGEQLFISDDAIIVRDNRLIGPAGIMVGDQLQAVITGEHKLAVGRVLNQSVLGGLEIFRGRIRKVEDGQRFEVETFSMLEEGEWYFHPVPRVFAIDGTTKLYTEEGAVSGINDFLDYGENGQKGAVYTIIAKGDKAYMLNAMPYTKESIKGYVYANEEGNTVISHVKVYDEARNRWRDLKDSNKMVTLKQTPNTIIIKNGELVSVNAIKKGDTLTVMMVEDIYEQNASNEDQEDEEEGTNQGIAVEAQIILVE